MTSTTTTSNIVEHRTRDRNRTSGTVLAPLVGSRLRATFRLDMSHERGRALQNLEYRDPRPFLVRLWQLEPRVAASSMPKKVKNLRTNSLKWERELREGALFCYGMSQRIGQTVFLSPHESQDYDFVTSWAVGDSIWLRCS